MPRLKVTMDRIDVIKDGDGAFDGKGDFFFDMVVQGTKLITVPRNENIGKNDGEKILLNRSADVIVPDDGTLYVSGWVGEADGGLAGPDDRVGSFDHVHSAANGWGVGRHQIPMTRKAHVVVHYQVDHL